VRQERAVASTIPAFAGLCDRRANLKVGVKGGDCSDNEFSGEAESIFGAEH
jgi:hypothetical protein